MATRKKKVTAMTVPGSAAMAVTGDVNDDTGKGGFGQDDITFPRIAFAQKTSPQLDSSNDDYIKDLKMYEMFNSLTGRVYGNEIKFAIIRRMKRAIEFDDEGTVVDFDVPLDDERLDFTDDGNGGRQKPKATLFYDYLIAIPGEDGNTPELGILSLKTTQIKNAKKLNSLIAVRPGAIYAGLWVGTTSGKTSGSYSYTNFRAMAARGAGEELFTFCADVYAATEGKRLDTERESTDDRPPKDNVPF